MEILIKGTGLSEDRAEMLIELAIRPMLLTICDVTVDYQKDVILINCE